MIRPSRNQEADLTQRRQGAKEDAKKNAWRAFLAPSRLCVMPALLFFANLAQACNVPVFRWALERWPADAYQVVVYHRGPLDAQAQAGVDLVRKHINSDQYPANVALTLVDLDKTPIETPPKDLPWLVVHYPESARVAGPIWAGRLTPDVVRSLLNSPARRQIAERILGGESVVWVLLESGDPSQDAAAHKFAESQLQELQKTLKLPELTDTPADQLAAAALPLRLAFSVVRVSRTDPAEALFIQMLLHTEDDLPGRKEPMLFPVFGRGRARFAFVGKGINAEQLAKEAAFLVGPCSCRVKRDNPGVDLLMTVNWDGLIQGKHVKELVPPPLIGLSRFVDAGPIAQNETSRPAERPPEVVGPPSRNGEFDVLLIRNVALAVVAGLVIVLVWFFLLKGKRKPPELE